MRKILSAIFLSTVGSLCAQAPKGCDPGPAWWYELRHREARGLGYEEGYTTGAVFLTPRWDNPFQPFVDIRLHVFNDGKWDTNAGVGFRHLTDFHDVIYGFNAYFDYRDTAPLDAIFQLGAGFELFSRYIDFRLNGYALVGNSKGSESPEFSSFCGNTALGEQKLSAGLPHINAEFGFPFRKLGPIALYFAIGPYYLFERCVEGITLGQAWGGQARLELDLYDSIFVGGNLTYDEIFDVRAQIYFGFSLPLGPRNVRQGTKRFKEYFPEPCTRRAEQVAILTQRVERDEIIPIQEKKNFFSLLPSGCNCRMLFVNNCFNGCGTFESPFATLLQAEEASCPGDIIYVFAGKRGIEGYDQGIVLQDNQKLIGSAACFELCDICIPACTPGCFPLLTNFEGTKAIVLAENNEVAGFHIFGPTDVIDTRIAIDTEFAGNYCLRDLIIEDLFEGIGIGSEELTPGGCKTICNVCIQNNDADTFGVHLLTEFGNVSVDHLTIANTGGVQFIVDMGEDGGDLTVSNSSFSNQVAPDLLVFTSFLADGSSLNFFNNCLAGLDAGALEVDFNDVSFAQASLCNNNIQVESGLPFQIRNFSQRSKMVVRCNQLNSLESSDESFLQSSGDPADFTTFCIENNYGNTAIRVDLENVTSEFTPACLRLVGNALSEYFIGNNAVDLGLEVESTDGFVTGVEALNESGSVTLEGQDVSFVCPGSCNCCP